ncbi:hypothetical protein M9458_046016, partial [Cirrhinus mrigala]
VPLSSPASDPALLDPTAAGGVSGGVSYPESTAPLGHSQRTGENVNICPRQPTQKPPRGAL